MKIEEKIQEFTSEALKKAYEIDIPASEIQVQETRKEFKGEVTVVIFPLIKLTKKSPDETAQVIGEYLMENMKRVKSFSVVKGFLNLALTDYYWINHLMKYPINWIHSKEQKKIMVEYSSPNTNKPLHLGHVRNILLGYSISQILKARGHEVTMTSLVNDRGIHICKSMIAWQKFGNGETPDSPITNYQLAITPNTKGDHLVGKYYVEFDKHYKDEIKELVASGMDQKVAEKQAPIMLEAQEMLRKWEEGDPEVKELWKTMNGWVYEGFDVTYKSLGVYFDKLYYESQTYLLGKDIVNEGLKKGVFFRKEDGSIWIDLTDVGLDQKVVLRGDGTSLYITQDLGTVQERFQQYHLDKLIYIVGNEQEYHFKVLKQILLKLEAPWANSIQHLSYGMVELPEGKMKSREGTVVDADDLINEMINEAAKITAELGKISEMPEEDQKVVYTQIGMAALKFYILKTDPKKQMLFNPAESIELQGFTGPFVQYTCARINSILRKFRLEGEEEFHHEEYDFALNEEEKDVLRLIVKKDDVLKEAEQNLSPALLANYVYDLAKTYNKFYHEHSVLSEMDDRIRSFRIVLSEKTATVLKNVLSLLGMEVPEKM